eukprot:gene3098-biopygen7421
MILLGTCTRTHGEGRTQRRQDWRRRVLDQQIPVDVRVLGTWWGRCGRIGAERAGAVHIAALLPLTVCAAIVAAAERHGKWGSRHRK